MNNSGGTIVAQGLSKRYAGAAEGAGLREFDLQVAAGTVCGLLGPNGAGKTTAVRLLSTLLEPDAGRAWVAGYELVTQARQVRERIGLVGQYAAVDEILTGRQNLVLFGRLHHLPAGAARQRADQLLEQFGLAGAADRPVRTYSGGMRRRLDLAASLIVRPAVLFVDEPTTGLDPAGRREVWEAIRSLVGSGTTVLLTSQYLEEADQLADRIVLLKAGRIAADGSPSQLKAAIGPDWIEIVFASAADLEAAEPLVARVAAGPPATDGPALRISVPVAARAKALAGLVTALQAAGIEPQDLTLRRPTLDEVFLHLTAEPAESVSI